MSDIQGNPHHEEVLSQYHYIGESWMAEEGMTDATMVAGTIHTQALATLALAYEQRTANLIAYLEHTEDGQYEIVWNGLQERLGLSDE